MSEETLETLSKIAKVSRQYEEILSPIIYCLVSSLHDTYQSKDYSDLDRSLMEGHTIQGSTRNAGILARNAKYIGNWNGDDDDDDNEYIIFGPDCIVKGYNKGKDEGNGECVGNEKSNHIEECVDKVHDDVDDGHDDNVSVDEGEDGCEGYNGSNAEDEGADVHECPDQGVGRVHDDDVGDDNKERVPQNGYVDKCVCDGAAAGKGDSIDHRVHKNYNVVDARVHDCDIAEVDGGVESIDKAVYDSAVGGKGGENDQRVNNGNDVEDAGHDDVGVDNDKRVHEGADVKDKDYAHSLFEIEVDINHPIAIHRSSDAHLLKATKPGFFAVKFSENVHHCYPNLIKTDHLSSSDVNEEYSEELNNAFKAMHTILSSLLKQELLPSPLTNVKFFDNSRSSSVANTHTFIMSNDSDPAYKEYFQVDMDFVQIIKLMYWPDDVTKWLEEGKWPTIDVRKQLKEKFGCCLVPKQSSPGANDWRLSLADIESEVITMLFENEHCYLAHFVFKCLYYKHINSIKCQCRAQKESPIGSYIIKTTLLNMSSEHGPDSPLWNDMKSAVMELLIKLLFGLQEKRIPHYIIPNVNILHSILTDHEDTCNLTHKAEKTVKFIIENIDSCLEEVAEGLNWIKPVKFDDSEHCNFKDMMLQIGSFFVGIISRNEDALLSGQKDKKIDAEVFHFFQSMQNSTFSDIELD